ncbi:cupredoxin domain-containing protein [Aerosakkonemataceae cyanobacterium BLCC-F154]|uniref:Cupredoxin domain-containing protein n=1 Tax=Floridaenema fluviatile BLCC-F154 TaxID=3153640 RepID=A0ABV4YC46_9CYAN
MLSKKIIFINLVGLGFLLGISSGLAATKMPMEMPASETEKTVLFRKIEQPLGLKIGVTLGGLGLIGLELWWFMFSKTKAKKADANQGIQEMTITVDGGYEPSRVVVQAGQPVRLNFFRRDPSSCLEKVLIPDFHIAKDLDLNHVTPVEFTPKKPGQYSFTCGMNMFRGVVEVQPDGTSQKS